MCNCKTRKKRGSGFISDLLPGPMGLPLKMIGLGRKRRGGALSMSGNALRMSGNRMYRGNGLYGDMLAETLDKFGRAGLNELGRLARKV